MSQAAVTNTVYVRNFTDQCVIRNKWFNGVIGCFVYGQTAIVCLENERRLRHPRRW